jgi:hypothetical protein
MFAPVTRLVPTPRMLVCLAEQFQAAGDRVTAVIILGLAETLMRNSGPEWPEAGHFCPFSPCDSSALNGAFCADYCT